MSSNSEDEPFQSSGNEFMPSNDSGASENNLYEEKESTDKEAANNKHGRKKIRDHKSWKRNVQKIKRARGEAYKSTTTGKVVPERKQGDDCKCSKKCIEKLSKNGKQEIISVIPNKESKVTKNIVKIETTTDQNVKGTTAVTANEESRGTKNVTKIKTTETTPIDTTTSTHIETTTTEKTKIVPLSATFNISEVESSVNETTRNPREETEKDDPEFAEKESQESDESSEEDDEEDENMVTGILSALLGGLSKPDGGIDLDAIVGLIGSLSTQNDDGSYDFSGLTELLKGFFGGGGDGGGGSDIGAFAGGLLGAIIKGIANPPGGKGVGVLTAKLLSGILPALSVEVRMKK
ncbi:DNA ligase 1-like [Diabrotica virgifera virgifera]|uniref:Uncharacterized protein n=1 Tax=Diabrotica virgifera virgifera TaxID=50390 RepID=A0ABM5KCH0_DIAVI|nr:DNA ligase 1-like [Diabrotica virgifera virgifera]